MDDSATTVVDEAVSTKLLMTASASFMALLGGGASFFPHEILAHFGAQTGGVEVVLISIVGALYAGFAVLNWMARGNLVGGIYSRPVAIGNFVHFLPVAIVLLKQVIGASYTVEFAVGAAAYAIFAACFGYIAFAGGGSCG